MADLVRAKGSDTGFEPTNDWESHLSNDRLSDEPTTYCGKRVGRVLLYDTTFVPNCPTCAAPVVESALTASVQ